MFFPRRARQVGGAGRGKGRGCAEGTEEWVGSAAGNNSGEAMDGGGARCKSEKNKIMQQPNYDDSGERPVQTPPYYDFGNCSGNIFFLAAGRQRCIR